MSRRSRRLVRRHASDNFPDLPSWLARLVTGRGIESPDQLDHSLAGLEPPDSLKQVAEAASVITAAILAGDRILIVGDYDADGATSTALMMLALSAMGAADVKYLVPDRFRFGYGLSPGIVEEAKKLSPALIITVDNGISSVDGVAAANAAGIRTVVTDHHLPGVELPLAEAIVNPNQPGCEFPAKSTAGVGVAFYVLSQVRRMLREQGRPGGDVRLADYLDLVALGTVADVVPLEKNNRILVTEGLRRLRAGRGRPGIQALAQLGGVDVASFSSRDLAFAVGPRLNAAGRLDNMALGIECLLAQGAAAMELAQALSSVNESRREIEQDMKREALAKVEDKANLHEFGVSLYEPSWHEGVVGIVAARIRERLHRPVVAFAPAADGSELKGSARSIPGFHVRDAIDRVATRHPGLISRYGGHAMAAGLSLAPTALETFSAAFDDVAREWIAPEDLEETVLSDGELEDFSVAHAQQLVTRYPWGQGFPEPHFDGRFEVIEQRIVGGGHLKLRLRPDAGAVVIDAIAFGVDRLLEGHYHHFSYRPDINRYQGRESLQLLIDCIDPVIQPGH